VIIFIVEKKAVLQLLNFHHPAGFLSRKLEGFLEVVRTWWML
jgi:hypothetical protein